MTPAHDELCHAIIALGSETCAMHDVRLETLHRLAALDLVRHETGGWALTNAGSKLLLRLVDGEQIEPLVQGFAVPDRLAEIDRSRRHSYREVYRTVT